MGMGLSSSGDDAGMVLTVLGGLAGAAEDARGAGADEDEEEEDGDGEDGCDGEDADQVEDDWALEEEADVERQRERIDAEPRCAEVEACADERAEKTRRKIASRSAGWQARGHTEGRTESRERAAQEKIRPGLSWLRCD
ncbi:hypothetical protein L1887_54045 [Cichorium endivia]|nr:hypothetical protein L1887_54045 [Cichorium endivia]